MAAEDPALAVVVKGWPRLSETFVANELKALEDRGLRFDIWSLRHPTDAKTHPVAAEIAARVRYLPEYLLNEPLRTLRGVGAASRRRGFARALRAFFDDLGRDLSFNRVRRFGQACVMVAEMGPQNRFIYVHFLHTPGSVARYAALMTGAGWGFSAHARDIWTQAEWDLRQKLAEARFGVTCTAAGEARLRELAEHPDQVRLLYHGLDLARFPPPPAARPAREGTDPEDPLQILSVGRLVEKKGYPDLITALADLPRGLHWRLTHIGGGPMGPRLKARAEAAGIARRIEWRGACEQPEVIRALRAADLFVLPARMAADGDRDGLPNVLLEAASQELPVISTAFSAIPEFVRHGETGVLVAPGAPRQLAEAILRLARNPDLRAQLARGARARLVAHFGAAAGADVLAARLKAELAAAP